MKYIIPVFFLFLLACTPKSPKDAAEDSTTPDPAEEMEVSNLSEAAKNWLITAIDSYFAEELPKMEKITTERFQNYWNDQMEVEYGDMPVAVFNEKWKSQYDVERAGIGTGLFIDAQDYHTIKIISCSLVGKPSADNYNFQLKLKDEGFNQEYEREVTVIPAGDSFLIDDVKLVK